MLKPVRTEINDPTNDSHISSINPATLEVVGEVKTMSREEVLEAMSRAREAQKGWAELKIREHVEYLARARDWLVEHSKELANLIVKENGKPYVEALNADIFPVIQLLDYYQKQAPQILAPELISLGFWSLFGRHSMVEHIPRGVVAVISPWNYPFSIPAGDAIQALVAGNAVILKPSPLTPLIGEKVAEMFWESGVPREVIQVVQGDGRELVDAGPDFIAFTGSVKTGKHVMGEAARNLTPVKLELGGKDPMIVLKDADIDVASSAAVWGAFTNAGQVCASVERVYVHESIFPEFVDLVVEKTSALRQGNGLDPNTDVGPIISKTQLNSVANQVERAKAEGARVLIGGEFNPEAGKGYFYKPTVLVDVQNHFECMQEETFGPTMPIMSFSTEEEAIALANDSKFGLNASLWTKNLKRGKKLARKIVAGTVMINDNLVTHAMPATPWGGFKDSGIGRTHGKYGLMDFTEPRHIHTNPRASVKNPWMFPYSKASINAVGALVQMFENKIGKKASGLISLIKNSLKAYKKLN